MLLGMFVAGAALVVLALLLGIVNLALSSRVSLRTVCTVSAVQIALAVVGGPMVGGPLGVYLVTGAF